MEEAPLGHDTCSERRQHHGPGDRRADRLEKGLSPLEAQLPTRRALVPRRVAAMAPFVFPRHFRLPYHTPNLATAKAHDHRRQSFAMFVDVVHDRRDLPLIEEIESEVGGEVAVRECERRNGEHL